MSDPNIIIELLTTYFTEEKFATISLVVLSLLVNGIQAHGIAKISAEMVQSVETNNRALTTQLRAHPLLAAVLAHSSGTWGVLFYESDELGRAIDALCNDLARAQSEGIARVDLASATVGRSLGNVIAGTLWPVYLQHGRDHALTEQSLSLILDSVLVPDTGSARLAERVAPWRKAHPWFPLRRQQMPTPARPLESPMRQAARA